MRLVRILFYKMRWNYVEYARYGSVGHQYAS